MEIVVFSDSHSGFFNMEKIMSSKRGSDLFIHAGDGAYLFTSICKDRGLTSRAVKGNCDFYDNFGVGKLPDEEVIDLDGVRIFLTHGNKYFVDYSTERLEYRAIELSADIAVFGHTHEKMTKYIPESETNPKPLYILNPGSIERPRDGAPSFGTIDIVNGKIVINTETLY